MLTEKELAALTNTKSETEWNDVCDSVKAAREGQYPSDWYQKVVLSGLASRMSASWTIQKIRF